MSPELGQILGRAEKGTRFRLRDIPQVRFEVLDLVTEIVDGEEALVGYNVEGQYPEFSRQEFMGKGVECSEGNVEIVKPE